MSTLDTPPPTPPDLPSLQRDVRNKLAGLAGKVRMQIALDAVARGLLTLLGLLTLSLLLDYWLELSVAMRLFYWLITLAAGAHFLFHYGYKPLSNKLGPIALAQAVDNAKGYTGTRRLAPRVATVLQLPGMLGDDGALSSQMIRDAVSQSYESLQDREFNGVLNRNHFMQCFGLMLVALMVPGIVGGVMANAGENVLGTWAQRWLMLSDDPYPRNTQIEVVGLTEDGKLIVPTDEKATLRSIITTKDGSEVEEARIEITPPDGKKQTLPLTRFDASDFRLDMNPLNGVAEVTIRAGDQSRSFVIESTARPRLTGLTLTHTHPADPEGKKTVDFNGADGEVSLLPLNEVELQLTANVEIAEARYLTDEDSEDGAPALPPIKRTGENAFTIAWTHEERQRLRVELVSKKAGLVSHPIPISVGLKTDRKPSVRLRSSGVSQRITPTAMIPLDLEARDDYGLRNMGLQIVRVRVGEDGGEKSFDPVTLYEDEEAKRRDKSEKLNVEVDEFGVRPTDVIRFSGIASDDRYVGSQTGESTQLTFRVVTHKELFREIIMRQQQARATFRQAIEDSKDILGRLKEAENGSQASANARRFRAVQRSVWKVGRELERSAEEMRLNRLGGDKEGGNQAYESMKATILEPLAKLHDRTMSGQRDALEGAKGGPEKVTELVTGQENVIAEMNALLARMDRWDELLDAINQLTEVIDQQQQLKKKLEELTNEQFDDLFD